MGHIKTLSLKIIFSALPLFLILTFAGNLNWTAALTAVLVLTAAAYALGDIFILPQIGNLPAAMIDGATAFLILWAAQYTGITINLTTIIYTALAAAVLEALLYHPFLERLVSTDSMGPKIGDRN